MVQPKMEGWEARLDLANELMMRDLADDESRARAATWPRGRVTPTRSGSSAAA